MKKYDYAQVLLCLVAFAAMGFFLLYGPTEHRSATGLAFLGLVTTVAASLRGRMIKRSPEKAKTEEEKKTPSTLPPPSDSVPPTSD